MLIVVRRRRERLLYLRFGLWVGRGRGLIEDEDGRIGQDRSGDRDPQALAA